MSAARLQIAFHATTIRSARFHRGEGTVSSAGCSRRERRNASTTWTRFYERPADYDLEHEGDDEDVRFYTRLMASLRPRRVLELACGSGRVTIPLAQRAARDGCDVVGLDIADTMLAAAERKRAALPPDAGARVTFVRGDVRCWRDGRRIRSDRHAVRVVVPPADHRRSDRCVGVRLRQSARRRLFRCRRADAESRRVRGIAPRSAAELLELEIDTRDPETNDRLVRYKTTRYLAHEQRAAIRFLSDKFPD